MASEFSNFISRTEEPRDHEARDKIYGGGFVSRERDVIEHGVRFEETRDPHARNIKNDGQIIGSLQWHSDRSPQVVFDVEGKILPVTLDALEEITEAGHRQTETPSQFDHGYSAGIIEGRNRLRREIRESRHEPTPEELGQAEKLRLLARLAEIGLPYDEALVLQREELEKDGDSPLTYVADIALGLDGIRRYLRMSFDETDSELQTLTSTQIPIEDYPKYSGLADQVIQKYLEAHKPS